MIFENQRTSRDCFPTCFRNAMLYFEQRKIITEALASNKLIICETLEPSQNIQNSEAKHFVLIVKSLDNKLFIHDPLLLNRAITSEKFKNSLDECGSNLEMDCDYFFSNETGPIKPKPNQYQTDWGYKFILISRLVKKSK
jgi:hypothetical protein